MLVTFRTNKDVKYARSFYGQSMPCLSNIGTTYQFLFLGVSCQIKQFNRLTDFVSFPVSFSLSFLCCARWNLENRNLSFLFRTMKRTMLERTMFNRSDNWIVVVSWIAFALLGAAYLGLVVDGLFRLAFQQIQHSSAPKRGVIGRFRPRSSSRRRFLSLSSYWRYLSIVDNILIINERHTHHWSTGM